jgi:hypothetical protein
MNGVLVTKHPLSLSFPAPFLGLIVVFHNLHYNTMAFTLASIQSFIWCHVNNCLEAIIVSKLNSRQVLYAATLEV